MLPLFSSSFSSSFHCCFFALVDTVFVLFLLQVFVGCNAALADQLVYLYRLLLSNGTKKN